MKRRRSIAMLAPVLAIAIAACGESAKTKPDSTLTPAAGLKMLVTGELTIGSDIPFAPFESLDDKGNPIGFDVELLDEVAHRLGLRTSWNNAVFDTIFTAVGTKWDVVASAVTAYAPPGSSAAKTVADRATIVAFSKAYYSSLQSLAVNSAKTPNISSTSDLKRGDKVAVQTGTTGAFWAKENLESKGVVLVGFEKAPDMFLALEAGRAAGVVNDLPVSLDAIKGKADLKVVQQIDTGEQYAFAFAKDNTALLDAVNAKLDEVFKDGTYARLFKKYFPDQQLPPYATATPTSTP